VTFCVPCLFGLEGLAADELKVLGAENVRSENGRVLFDGEWRDMVRSNLWLRTGERVYVLLGEFPAQTFDALFEGVKALPWEEFVDYYAKFPVKAGTLDSALKSLPDIQRIVKKAAADRLGQKYRAERLPETGGTVQIRCSLFKDRASIYLDTSGPSLHKRGWRAQSNEAPLRETLAAAMVKLSRYKGRETFLDPFCGSGTIAIEAALAAVNLAPGQGRSFAAEGWKAVPAALWAEERASAREREYRGDYHIFASDIDAKALEIARVNAEKAGVAQYITFSRADARDLTLPPEKGVLITNPPYGDRLMDAHEAEVLYRALGRRWRGSGDWRIYLLTSNLDFEKSFGKRASKRRKLYNGMIQCQLYMYF